MPKARPWSLRIGGKAVARRDWIPTRDECLAMLDEERVPDKVKEHILAVAGLAMKIGERMKEAGVDVDLAVIEAGALLHDIGRARTHGMRHALEGTYVLAEKGVSQKVIDVVLNHIGAGLDKDEAGRLGLPAQDYIPVTLEQKVVSASDNLFSGSKRILVKEEMRHLEKKGQPNAARKVGTLHRELCEIVGVDLDDMA